MKMRSSWAAMFVVGAAIFATSPVLAQYADFKAANEAGFNNFMAANFEAAKKDYEQAVALAKNPQDKAKVLGLLGTSQYATKEYALARASLEQVLDMEGVDKKVRANAQWYLAKAYWGEKNYERAHEEFAIYLADPDVHPAMRFAVQLDEAQAYIEEKKFESARATFSEMEVTLQDMALVKGPEAAPPAMIRTFQASIQQGIAQTLSGEKNYAGARALLIPLLEVKDTIFEMRPRVQFDIALTYVLEKNYAQAQSEYRKLLAMPGVDPNLKASVEKRLKLLEQLEPLITQLEKDYAAEAQPRLT